jgi:hypothetical protein
MKQPFRSRSRGRNNRPLNTLTDLTREFFSLANESSQVFLSGPMDLAQRGPTLGLPRQHKVWDCHCDCEDPPPEPERCEIDCQTYQGEHIVSPIRVVNLSKQSLTFNAAAQPWQGAGGDTPSPSIQLDQTSFTLGPNQSRILIATSEISEQFKPGSSYRTEVTLSSELGQDKVCLTVYISARE